VVFNEVLKWHCQNKGIAVYNARFPTPADGHAPMRIPLGKKKAGTG
jgi:hypothetical protein